MIYYNVCYRAFDKPPKPSVIRLHEASRAFYVGIQSSLKSKSIASIYIPMELDVWRYVCHQKGVESKHKGYKLYTIADLCLLDALPDYWWYYLNDHGQGQAVKSPLKIKPVISWSSRHNMYKDGKLVPAPRMPIEKLCVHILRRACGSNNLFQ